MSTQRTISIPSRRLCSNYYRAACLSMVLFRTDGFIRRVVRPIEPLARKIQAELDKVVRGALPLLLFRKVVHNSRVLHSKPVPMSTLLEGGCLCGKVRFIANQPPVRTLVCHCTFCQRVTGSAFYAESIFLMDAVRFNEGELRRYEHLSDGSKKKVFVHFCPSCGTTVGLTFERWPDVRAISRGCYDDPNAVEITSHIWTGFAQSGVVLPAGIECFVGARATLQGQPEQAEIHHSPLSIRR